MGVIGNIIGASGAIREAGEAVGGVAEVFVGNAAARDAAAEARIANALTQLEGEFASAGGRGFGGDAPGQDGADAAARGRLGGEGISAADRGAGVGVE